MPIIPYIIQRSVRKIIKGKQRWFNEYEPIFVDVSGAVAAFLAKDDKREQRYQWKIKKQKQAAKIYMEFSLDEVGITADGDECFVQDSIEDTFHPRNRNPLTLILEDEYIRELEGEYFYTMSRKQFDAFRFHEYGYSNTEIAEMFSIDESSVRERLYKAFAAAVFSYLKYSNSDLLQSIKKEVKEIYKDKSEHIINGYVATLFLNRLFFFRPDQRHLLDFVNGENYEETMNNYFRKTFFLKTPENP